MAIWRKVVVSGSDAHLTSLGVGSADAPAAAGNISASGKLFASSSEHPSAGTYNVVIIGPNGEFRHTGSDAISPSLSALSIGSGLLGNDTGTTNAATSYDGGTAVTITINTGSTGTGIAGDGLEPDTGGGGLKVKANGNLTVGSTGVAVNTASLVDVDKGLSADSGVISSLGAGKIGVNIGTGIGYDPANSNKLTGSFVASQNLTVDNVSLELNSGTTFNGTDARTISIKSGSIAGTGITAKTDGTGFELTTGTVTANTLLKWNGTGFADSLITEGSSTLNLGGASDKVVVAGNLRVEGTASFTHASNLDIADDFILMRSASAGAASNGPFGIIGQTGSSAHNAGVGWIYNGSSRFALVTGSNISQGGTVGTTVGFASLMVNSTDTAITSVSDPFKAQSGNFLVDGSDDIYVYF